jgi:hypothetical protein
MNNNVEAENNRLPKASTLQKLAQCGAMYKFIASLSKYMTNLCVQPFHNTSREDTVLQDTILLYTTTGER